MILLVHDLSEKQEQSLLLTYEEKPVIVRDDGTIMHCVGCFACWIKTPGKCILKDGYSNLGGLIGNCSELHIVSRSVFGSYSPFVKNVLDRSISYIHPYFALRAGEMHHRLRYPRAPLLKIWFYGEDQSDAEQETARDLVKANALNLGITTFEINFVTNITEILVEV